MQNIVTPEHILEQMRVPELQFGMYFIGLLDQRITLYSQQVRALNLVYSLKVKNLLEDDGPVAVIGAGAAGLTAAAALAHLGKDVVLLDSDKHLLRFQMGSFRWVHPHIYDWPSEGAENPRAGLPLLDWTADLAYKVRAQILRGWEDLTQRNQITFVQLAKDIRFSTGMDRRHRLTYNAPGYQSKEFDTVILAIGFGEERSVAGLRKPSYWHNDHLHQPFPSQQSILISGNGDGGLIDLLRTSLDGFNASEIINDLQSLTDLTHIKAHLSEIENQNLAGKSDQWLSNNLFDLEIPSCIGDYVRAKRRDDTIVSFNGSGDCPFSWNSSPLNRFLSSCLIRFAQIPYLSGRIVSAQLSGDNKHRVEFDSGQVAEFNYVVARHGPIPPINGFVRIADKLQTLKGNKRLDQTRTPIFDESGMFSVVSSRGHVTVQVNTSSSESNSTRDGDVIQNNLVASVTPFERLTGSVVDERPELTFNITEVAATSLSPINITSESPRLELLNEDIDPVILQEAAELTNKLEMQVRRWQYNAAMDTATSLEHIINTYESRLPLITILSALTALSENENVRRRQAMQSNTIFDTTKLRNFLTRTKNVRQRLQAD